MTIIGTHQTVNYWILSDAGFLIILRITIGKNDVGAPKMSKSIVAIIRTHHTVNYWIVIKSHAFLLDHQKCGRKNIVQSNCLLFLLIIVKTLLLILYPYFFVLVPCFFSWLLSVVYSYCSLTLFWPKYFIQIFSFFYYKTSDFC